MVPFQLLKTKKSPKSTKSYNFAVQCSGPPSPCTPGLTPGTLGTCGPPTGSTGPTTLSTGSSPRWPLHSLWPVTSDQWLPRLWTMTALACGGSRIPSMTSVTGWRGTLGAATGSHSPRSQQACFHHLKSWKLLLSDPPVARAPTSPRPSRPPTCSGCPTRSWPSTGWGRPRRPGRAGRWTFCMTRCQLSWWFQSHSDNEILYLK